MRQNATRSSGAGGDDGGGAAVAGHGHGIAAAGAIVALKMSVVSSWEKPF